MRTRLMMLKTHVETAANLSLYSVALSLCFSNSVVGYCPCSCILIFSSSKSYLYLLPEAMKAKMKSEILKV